MATAGLLLWTGCAVRSARLTPHAVPRELPRIEYSIQVGAFADPENARRLIATLAERGLEAFYFVGERGIYKVRFGSFASRELAVRRADAVQEEGVIDDYFVVAPRSISLVHGGAALRGDVVRSALAFLGRPYRWGGSSPDTGLDCSGLTMTAYRLNGLALPRAAAEQFASGEPVSARGLQEADLVFFATESGARPTHVGLYLGGGRFIHAPGRGGKVRIDELASRYYQRTFLAGRSYLTGG